MDEKALVRLTAVMDQKQAAARDSLPEAKAVLERLVETVAEEDLLLEVRNLKWGACYPGYDGIFCVGDLWTLDDENPQRVGVAVGKVNPLEAVHKRRRLIETCELSTFGPEDVETLEDVLERLRGCS